MPPHPKNRHSLPALESRLETDYTTYQVKPTADGAWTLYSERFQEACHSYQGAQAETQKYYLEGCQVLERAKTLPVFSLLEVGFGFGLGYQLTHEAFEKAGLLSRLHYLALEIDEGLVEFAKREHLELTLLKRKQQGGLILYQQPGLTVLVGDARETLPLYLQQNPECQAMAIYQDAFSPRQCPELWSTSWFSTLKQAAHQDCLLSTYSTSSRMRKSLLAAGWSVHQGKTFGRKVGSTTASLNRPSDPALLEKLDRSPVEALE